MSKNVPLLLKNQNSRVRVEAILKFLKPQIIVEFRRFVGTVNFSRRNMPRAGTSKAPLNALLSDSRKNDKRPVP